MQTYIEECIRESIAIKDSLLSNAAVMKQIERVAKKCISTLASGRKILLAGNGGSAADAQHIAAEFVNRFVIDRPGLAAIALTTDTSVLTSIGNDYGYEQLFLRQLQALGQEGDLLLALSTSGNSPNLIAMIDFAEQHRIQMIGLSGEGGVLSERLDECIQVPSRSTARIQESHILIAHIICGLVEHHFFAHEE